MKTKIFTIAFLSIFSTLSFAQAPNWVWAKSAGGSGNDEGQVISADAAGDVYVAGNFTSSSITFGTDVLTSSGPSNIYVAKYDASGNTLWARSGVGSSYNGVGGMAADAAGNAYVCGYFDSPTLTFGSISLSNAGASDAFVVKYDPSGNVLWARRSGGSGYDQMQAVVADASGNVYVCGIYQNDNFTIGTITLPSDGDNDSFIAKYDSSGNVLWARQIAGTSWDDIYGIGVDGNGNPYVDGYSGSPTLSFGTVSLTNSSGFMIFVARYEPNGNVIWAKGSTGSGANFASTIAVDPGGDSYLTGYLTGTLQFGNLPVLTSAGGSDLFVARFDSSGNAIWANSAGGTGSEIGYGLAADGSGSAYATGYFGSSTITFGSTTLNNDGASGDVTIFVVKYDSSGKVSWALNPVGSTNDMGEGMAVDENGNVFVSGGFGSPELTFGSTTLTNEGVYNIFVAKLGSNCNLTQPTISASGSTSFCQGDSVILTSSVANSYLWNNNDTSRSITVTANGSYSVAVSNGAGCNATSEPAIVTVSPAVYAGIVKSSPDTICNDLPVALTVTGSTGNSFQWQFSNTLSNFSNINGITDSAFIDTLTRSTYFRVYVSSGACSDTSATAFVKVYPAVVPPVLSTSDSLICASDSARIQVLGSYASYLWNDGDTNSYTYVDVAGDNWVTVTDADGCLAVSGLQKISVYPVPSVSVIVQGDTLNSFGEVSYQWFLNGDSIPSANGPVYIVTQSGNYSVEVTDSNGCTARSNNTQVVFTGITQIHETAALNIYPNPVTNSIFIHFNGASNLPETIQIIDATGRILMKQEPVAARGSLLTIDVNELPAGLYYIKIETTNATFIRKIIKQ